MSSLNKVMLIGRLGKDPEIRYTTDGSAVANFSLATSDFYADKSGARQERTEWHNIVAWGKLADLAKRFLLKGRQVYIEGRIRTREWDDKDGNKRRTTEIIASQMVLLGSKPEGMDAGGFPQPRSTPAGEPGGFSSSPGAPDVEITDDDIPF
jgi:single-strand DNA-binding protein